MLRVGSLGAASEANFVFLRRDGSQQRTERGAVGAEAGRIDIQARCQAVIELDVIGHNTVHKNSRACSSWMHHAGLFAALTRQEGKRNSSHNY